MTAFTHADWEARMMADHQAAVDRGLHDDQCEYGRRSKLSRIFLCHCHKRARECTGLTTPPTEDLYFPPPSCPHCSEGLNHDGDVWECPTCALSWSSDGDARSATFTDDYGDAVLTEEADDA